MYQTLFNYAQDNQAIVFENNLFGVDPDFGNVKAAVIFYTTDNFDTIKTMHGIEGTNATFKFI